MGLAKAFARQRRAFILAEMIAALLLIGVLDAFSGYQIRLLPFYTVPIFAVAWFCGKRSGIFVGLLAGLVSLTADWLDHDPDLQGWFEGWEILRHLASCLVIALVGSALRAKRDIATGRIALLEHSHRLEGEIVRISDAEQRRIGQDLHDGLCQCLAALACSAASLREDLEQRRLPTEAAAAGELAELLRDTVVQTRDLAHRLVPAHVARMGLPLALESLALSVTRLHGINCTFASRGATKEYDHGTAKYLYRIAQEAINNATKHGKAQNISVMLDRENGLTTLKVQDDGVGFPTETTNGSGHGLQIMRYRARLNGGELRIERPESGGTLISCTAKTHRAIDENAIA
ncbi:MAG TPA: ATP-binding protein [Chthoniobacterales bacterium]|jgi:signal transduction histidine kinase